VDVDSSASADSTHAGIPGWNSHWKQSNMDSYTESESTGSSFKLDTGAEVTAVSETV